MLKQIGSRGTSQSRWQLLSVSVRGSTPRRTHTAAQRDGPLHVIRVLDLTRVLAVWSLISHTDDISNIEHTKGSVLYTNPCRLWRRRPQN